MKNKIMYGILIFFLIISDLTYMNAFISGGFIPNDVSNDPSNLIIPLLFLINIISFVIGLYKINKQKSFALILIALSLPTLISTVWMNTHKNDFSPMINRSLKANISSAGWQIEKVHELTQSYLNACEDINVAQSINEVKKIGVEVKCFSDNNSYVLSAELKKKPKKDDRYYGYDYFCIDSAGSVESIKTSIYQSIINADTLCPKAKELQDIKKQVLTIVESYLRSIGKFDHVKMSTYDEVPYYESSINLDKTTFDINEDGNIVTIGVVIDFKGEIKRWDWNLEKYKDWEPIGSQYFSYKLIKKDGVFKITEGDFFDSKN